MIGETLPPRLAKLWVFDRVPVTLNQLLRDHWAKRGRDLESWKYHVLSVAGKRHKLSERSRVLLKITIYRARLQDPDNAVGSVKPLVDALTRIGWMVDDTVEWLDLKVEERIDTKEQRTEVYWEPI